MTWDSTPAGEYAEARLKAQVLDRSRGDFGLLETMRWDRDGGFRSLDLHLERLADSAAYFGFAFDRAHVDLALKELDARSTPARVGLRLDRLGRVALTIADAPEEGGTWRVAVDDRPVDRIDPFLHHKTTRRRVYDEARRRHPGVDDVLLVNDRGEVTESTIANVVVHVGEDRLTPPRDAGCLPGIHRRLLLERGEVREAPIPVSLLRAADRVELVNSLRGAFEAVVVADG